MIKVKCAWEPKHKDDGLRILVTRYHPRGLRRNRYDLRMPNLGPSERLFKNGKSTWREFGKAYREEMLGEDVTEKKNPRIRNSGQRFTLGLLKKLAKTQNITLMCNCPPDTDQCHRFLLRDLIKSNKI